MSHFDYVILGGGVAGLCAARHLLELGVHPLVIEGGGYPTHKVCGEFISPSSLPLLNQWDIHPVPIHHVELHAKKKELSFSFHQHAGSLSHLTLDMQLARQITDRGASLLTQTKVLNFTPPMHERDFHSLYLSTGEKIFAKCLLIATGRIPGYSSTIFEPRYIGLKTHFSGLQLNSTLYMFSFKGAYLGLSPVENGFANLACLSRIELFRQFSSPDVFIDFLIGSHPKLRELLDSGIKMKSGWMMAPIPEFGLRSVPDWPQTYWIGDAAGTIPPASGNGLSLAIASGYLAAEFAVKNQAHSFRQTWTKRSSLQIKLAKGLHRLFLNPSLGSGVLSLLNYFPSIPQKIFTMTRDQAVKKKKKV